MEKLDAWEQQLIQQMHINNDIYPSDVQKIAYAESRLMIRKKAHNLMNLYKSEGLCILQTFADWRAKFWDCCNNQFKEKDARIYLRDILKWDSMSFEEYYNFFAQEKEKSQIENISLIDAMKRNVNYSTQTSVLNWQKRDGLGPVILHDHIEMWSQTN